VAPDGMLCLGVKDYPDGNLRPSYVLWNERVIPLFVMEVVSKTTSGERTKKMDIYESVGILYYLIYTPLLKKKARFQLYKLIEGEYVLQGDGQQPYWMPEIALGIGVERFNYSSTEREWLFWYDEHGDRYLTPTERAEAARQETEIAKQQAKVAKQQAETAEKEKAAVLKRLLELGIDPDS
jgi:hypothetical protein